MMSPEAARPSGDDIVPDGPVGGQRSSFGLVLFDRDQFLSNGNPEDAQAGGAADVGLEEPDRRERRPSADQPLQRHAGEEQMKMDCRLPIADCRFNCHHCGTSKPARLNRQFRVGYSFTEVMFAVIVLGIGFIMVAAVFPVAIQQSQATSEETVGASVCAGSSKLSTDDRNRSHDAGHRARTARAPSRTSTQPTVGWRFAEI